MHHFLQRIQSDGVLRAERPHPLASQGADMALGAQNRRQVARQRSHIDALAGADGDFNVVGVGRAADLGGMDGHAPRRQFELHPVARQVIGAGAVHLDGGKARRGLVDLADEGGQGGLHLIHGRAHVRPSDDLALAVHAVGRDAPVDGEAIDLLRLHHHGHGLGRFAQRDGQDAAGQWVQRACVTGLLGVEQAADAADGLGRSHLERLVQAHPAVDDLALLLAAHYGWPIALRAT